MRIKKPMRNKKSTHMMNQRKRIIKKNMKRKRLNLVIVTNMDMGTSIVTAMDIVTAMNMVMSMVTSMVTSTTIIIVILAGNSQTSTKRIVLRRRVQPVDRQGGRHR